MLDERKKLGGDLRDLHDTKKLPEPKDRPKTQRENMKKKKLQQQQESEAMLAGRLFF